MRNVVPFGCFVNVGLKEDGLLHVSEGCPSAGIAIGDRMEGLTVKDIDAVGGKLTLTRRPARWAGAGEVASARNTAGHTSGESSGS